jgi:hypothetical protein
MFGWQANENNQESGVIGLWLLTVWQNAKIRAIAIATILDEKSQLNSLKEPLYS